MDRWMLTSMSISSISNDIKDGIDVHVIFINDVDDDFDKNAILYPMKMKILC